ncbi:MAG: glucokinase, partial [Caulobacteraceae bacterium]
DHADLASAWRAFIGEMGIDPGALVGASIAVAGPADAEIVKLTNSPWVIRRPGLAEALGTPEVLLLNDFGAMAWGVSALPPADLAHVAGPDTPLPSEGVISVIGPGTGLGLAQLIRRGGRTLIVECEGGHVDFAPLDPFEDTLLTRLRPLHGRVSVERLVSGPGLAAFREAVAGELGEAAAPLQDADLWARALAADDPLAQAALERLVLSYGAVAGDFALAQGAAGVALVGDLTGRILETLRGGAFFARFIAKGRHQKRMTAIPVRWAAHTQVGLLGAAVAFDARNS